jgi:Type IV secretion system pilin
MSKNFLIQASAYTMSGFVSLLVVSTAFGQEGTVVGNVTCGRAGQKTCDYNDLVNLVQNLITFVVTYVIIPVMVLIILRAGIKLVISGDKASAKSEAKESLKKAFIGLFFVLAAWLIVDALISAFGVKVSPDPTQGPLKILGE